MPVPASSFVLGQLAGLQQEIDARVNAAFRNITATLPAEPAAAAGGEQQQQQQQTHTFTDMDDAAFAALGRDNPTLLMALLEATQAADKAAWTSFQADLQTLKLKRQRLSGQLADARGLLDAAQREASKRQGLGAASGAAAAFDAETARMAPLRTGGAPVRPVRIVLVCGFESFNVALYNAAAKRLAALAPHIQLRVFSDRDIATRREAVAAALAGG
jgi:magnesium chelatase subunit H